MHESGAAALVTPITELILGQCPASFDTSYIALQAKRASTIMGMVSGSAQPGHDHVDPEDADSDDEEPFLENHVNDDSDDDFEPNPRDACIRGFMENLMRQDKETIRILLSEAPEEIFSHYPHLSEPSELDDRTVLHNLVDSFTRIAVKKETKKVVILRALFSAITVVTSHHPELLSVSASGKTPLYSVIRSCCKNPDEKLFRLVRQVIFKCKRPKFTSATPATADTIADDDAGSKENDDNHAQPNNAEPHPLTRALRVKCFDTNHGKGENVLHLALRNHWVFKSNMKALVRLASNADEETVIQKDWDGFSPLHYAVKYDWCSEDQLKIVNHLLQHGESATLIEEERAVLDILTKDGMSALQYHIWTRDNSRRQQQQVSITSTADNKPKPARDGRAENPDGREGPRPPTSKAKPGASEATSRGREAQSNNHAATREGSERPTQRKGVNSGQAAEPPVRPGVSRTLTAGPKEAESTTTAAGGKATNIKDEREKWSERLQTLLKVQCLRNRKREVATRLLYGKNPEAKAFVQDIQTWFDYQGGAERFTEQAFVNQFEKVTFESVLEYVAFPPVWIRRTKRQINNEQLVERRGRSDMELLFTWLREKKKVQRILKVIVEDSAREPHSDESIEKALGKFDVLSLSWSKLDLDPEVLYNAAPNLEDVVLHWSGNNAILRAWAEPQGLRRLLKLKKVTLVVDQEQALESRERLETNLENFKNRLKEECPAYLKDWKQKSGSVKSSETGVSSLPAVLEDPTLLYHTVDCHYELEDSFPRQPQASVVPLGSNVERPTTSNLPQTWLKAVDGFAERISNVWERILMDSKPAPANRPNEATPANTSAPRTGNSLPNVRAPHDVIIALIDDGVNTMTEHLSQCMLPGRTFGFEGDRNLPWYASETGHGTVMATMITRVCPMARIYPIRLQLGAKITAGTNAEIDIDSAAEAITAAVNRRADIISISWTVGKPKDDKLQDAIDFALGKGVLLFCSSGDSGHGGNAQHYPAKLRRDKVIKVGAAEPSGSPYDWAGPIEDLDFIFPGVEVVQKQKFRGQAMSTAVREIEDMEPKTGSSVATALGAGLAALVIYCARINQMFAEGEKLSDADVSKLRKSDVMIKAIRNFGMSSSDVTKNKFVDVSRKLEEGTQQLHHKNPGSLEARKIIARLARDLISVV
ncbi:intracellular serine protease [Colletotrichum karsti]|uniref:Intracellular serine protease n=1 Tax=Colletotrichum karsti TaxID=1095194 RepID=A0A9P6LJK4_9PEZI|nr:intracellular serine protease [Colletotrichum karsti]KAF9875773.1 intracellular serine protease [Colletotrichum karsti]